MYSFFYYEGFIILLFGCWLLGILELFISAEANVVSLSLISVWILIISCFLDSSLIVSFCFSNL